MARWFPGEQALYNTVHDNREVHDRITSLLFLRLLTDRDAPEVAGFDPRLTIPGLLHWDIIGNPKDGSMRIWWDSLSGQLNQVYGEDLLSTGWEDTVSAEAAIKLADQLGHWINQHPQSDLLAQASQELTYGSKKAALGQFYTPYQVCLMMAKMQAPQPGQSVIDPCCGAGSMLLAALESVREDFYPEARLELTGVDIDPDAVRLCKLNLILAGAAIDSTVICGNSLTMGLINKEPEPEPQGSLFDAIQEVLDK